MIRSAFADVPHYQPEWRRHHEPRYSHSSDRRAGRAVLGNGRCAGSGRRRGDGAPPCGRAQFHRHLSSHRSLSLAAAIRHRSGRRRGGRSGRRWRARSQGWRPRRLCRRPARCLCPGAQHSGAPAAQTARCHRLQDGGGDAAAGPDGDLPVTSHLSRPARRCRADPRRCRRRRPDCLPDGEGAGCDGDRHGRFRCQG